MAVDAVPFIIDGVATDGTEIRGAASSLLGPNGGVVGPGDFAVTQTGSPSMAVTVATGTVWIPATTSGQFQYWGSNPTATNVTITGNSSGNPRIDLIVAQADDGGSNTFKLAAIAGTPAASPSPPAAPNNSVTLAQVAVANGAANIVNANITDKRPRLQMLGVNRWVFTASVSSTTTSSTTTPGSTWCTVAVPSFPFQTSQHCVAVAYPLTQNSTAARSLIGTFQGVTPMYPTASTSPSGGVNGYGHTITTVTDPVTVAASTSLTYTAGLWTTSGAASVKIFADDTVSTFAVHVFAS